jgi:hypothetical protein
VPAARDRSWPSAVRAHGGCLGAGRRRRTWQAAISQGEGHAPIDPWISEWGNPAGVMARHPTLEGVWKPTRGTETSQYPEEEKSSEIPGVAASERGRAQTVGRESCGVEGPARGVARGGVHGSRSDLERSAGAGESPVGEPWTSAWCRYPSRPGFEEPWLNLGGPPSKAKYSPATDSARVP